MHFWKFGYKIELKIVKKAGYIVQFSQNGMWVVEFK